MLVIRRIHVRYHLRIATDQQEAAERVHRVHAKACPVYRTLSGCIDITTELDVEMLQ